MKDLRQHKIEIFGLKNGDHQFTFHFDNSFFVKYENSIVSKGKGSCLIKLTKTDSMLTLHFIIEGFIELECDRSLEIFDHFIKVNKNLIYKYGDEDKELSEDVYVITKNTQEINISSFLYELVNLEVPMKKLHPKFQDDNENDEMIFTSPLRDKKEETIDPRWEVLKSLRNKLEI
ncbi:MAG: DUF177 domain-containing protein [Bacteroidota bacterium]